GARAGPALAAVALCARVAVVARRAVGLRRVRELRRPSVTGTGHVALVLRRADEGIGARAGAALAGVALRARVAVVARRAVGLRGVRALPGRDVTGAGHVALVLRRADDGIGARAGAALAGVAQRARIAVGARRAVGLRRVR